MKKSVQIPLQIFLNLNYLLSVVDTNELKDKRLLEEAREYFADKSARLRNEAAYTEYMRASKGGRDAALETYLEMKKVRF